MRTIVKLSLAALTAAALLASLVGSASARSFSVTNRNFRAVFRPLTFQEPFNFFRVTCNVTMEGTFHENTIPKVLETLLGYVTRVGVTHPCTGGEGWAWNGTEGALTGASSLPWHIRYQGFTGTLPNITTIRVNLIRPKFSINNGICLGTYQPAAQRGILEITGGTTRIRADESQIISRIEGNCPEGRFAGTSEVVTLLGTTTAITVSLI